MPAISVILPTRNRHHLLPRALRSLLAQTFEDFEIIVVDDNPPESRVASVPELAILIQNPKIRLVEHENPRNASSARNAGLRAAQGQWITYLDDDDAYRPAKLERQIHAARASGLPIGSCGICFHLGLRQRLRWTGPPPLHRNDLLLNLPAPFQIFHQNAGSVFFDETQNAAEDAYFFLRLVDHFNPADFFHVSEPLVDVYPQTGSRVNTNAEAILQTMQAIHRDFGSQYSPDIAAVFLARMQMAYLKHQRGHWIEISRLSARLLRLRGLKDVRFIVNSMLFKFPMFQKWLVS